MIELERHIEVLLLDNDCVIVPDFGGFMAHHVAAHYVEEEDSFYPPIRTIGFNPQLTINDSLLAQSYIDIYDISYPEALRRIENEVFEIRQHLSNEGSYEMSDIGTIYLNTEGIYKFKPCEAGILTPELYGLSSLEIIPLLNSTKITYPIKKVETISAVEENVPDEQLEENKVIQTHNESPSLQDTLIGNEEENNNTVSIKVSLLRNIAAACLVVLAFFLFPSSLENNDPNTEQLSSIDTNLLYRIMPKEMTNTSTELKQAGLQKIPVQKEVAAASKETTEEPATEENKIVEKIYYSIVLASKVSLANAGNFVEELQKNGYKEAKVYTKNKSNKVIYGEYSTEQAAYNALNTMNHQKDFSDGWVMKVTSTANK